MAVRGERNQILRKGAINGGVPAEGALLVSDDVYYLESTNEFVIVATDGYIRTYFKPDDGKAYYDRQ